MRQPERWPRPPSPPRTPRSRPATASAARELFEPPRLEPVSINSSYLEPSRRKEAAEAVSLGDRIGHHFLPPPELRN